MTDLLATAPTDDSDESEQRSEWEDDDGLVLGYWARAEGATEGTFSELTRRASWLLQKYPLQIAGEVVALHADSRVNELYRFLILLRARQLYPNALGDDGARAGLLFEEVAKHALGGYLFSSPPHFVRFGVAGGSRGDNLPLDLAEATEELGRRMSEKVSGEQLGGQGDLGVDAIAWRPFGDNRAGQFVLICQATISEDEWKSKLPSPKWKSGRLIQFLVPPVTALAFPETLSLTPQQTIEGLELWSIPIDRLRLLSVLRDEDLPHDLLQGIRTWSDSMIGRLPMEDE